MSGIIIVHPLRIPMFMNFVNGNEFLTFQELVISFLQNAVQANLRNANQRMRYARM